MFLSSVIFFLMLILLSVAFFTLFERKILGIAHSRLGPNKNLFIGIVQPFSDLIKLFLKLDYFHYSIKKFMFLMGPTFLVFSSMMMWEISPHFGSFSNMKFFLILVMLLNGMNIFFFLFPGWSSGSFYSMIGSYRSSAQSISYEGSFFFCLLFLVTMMSNFNFSFFLKSMALYQNFIILMIILIPWIMSILAESNRSPFDFVEGESELVSGFNTEYGGGLFSLIFLSEYMSMLFMCYLTSIFFLGKTSLFFVSFFVMILIFVWVRVSFPRLRYDKLMMISWKSLMFFVTVCLIMLILVLLY